MPRDTHTLVIQTPCEPGELRKIACPIPATVPIMAAVSIQRHGTQRLAPLTVAASPDPARLLPASVYYDSADTPRDVIDALILAVFAEGSQPHARTTRLSEVRPGATLAPAGAHLLRAATDDGQECLLAAGEGWTARSVRWRSGAAEVTVTAATAETAEAVIGRIVGDAEVTRPADDDAITIGFWHRTERRGAFRAARAVTAEPWANIRANYASGTASALDRLMAVSPARLPGRLVLLYGPPGTGKTTALRSLAREWRPWCETDCVLDPEVLLGDPSYLIQAALGEETDEAAERWRLLLLEDCDELIADDAKRASGQALSRLLNLTDGLLGQGRNVLVGITTNEDIRSLHPAAIRPGRCLAQIEVGLLPAREAAAWLGRARGITAPMTLADMYASRAAAEPIASAGQAVRPGLYL